MRFAFCNEMFENQPLDRVCATARRLGYHGIEIAPFTLAKRADALSAEQRRETRRIVENAGLEVVGLHWLLAGVEGLHATTPDDAVWTRTRDYVRALVDLNHDLGGSVLVFGSPKQRSLTCGQTWEYAWGRLRDLFASLLDHAQAAGSVFCLEPLSPAETDFLNTVGEAQRMARELDHPALKVHLDVKAMASESQPIEDVIRQVTADEVGHVHVNDPNLYGPGMGEVDYAPLATALDAIGWDRWLSVEVFKYDPDPETIAHRSIEYLRRFWQETSL